MVEAQILGAARRLLLGVLMVWLLPSVASAGMAIPENYETLSARKKFQVLTALQEETRYAALPEWTGLEPLSLLGLGLPFRQSSRVAYMGVTVNRNSDFMPQGRAKPIHAHGSTAGIKFVVQESFGYSGIFASGAEHGFIRLSLAVKPSSAGMIPGLAVKFLVDGRPSVNLQAMHSLEAQASYNFFEHPFSNIIDEPTGFALKLLLPVFRAASDKPFALGLRHMAVLDASGAMVTPPEKIAFPERIYFIPTGKLRFDPAPHEIRDDLNAIPVGAILYHVWAVDKHGAERCLGHIESTTPFVSSAFGDAHLFFKHQRIEDDR